MLLIAVVVSVMRQEQTVSDCQSICVYQRAAADDDA